MGDENAGEENNRLEIISIERVVPKDHLLSKIEAAADFTKIYEFAEVLHKNCNYDKIE